MRALILSILFLLVNATFAKNAKTGISEVLGQDSIELVNPIKELPPNLEEEPATEKEPDTDDDDDPPSMVPLPPSHPHTTRREVKKSSVSLKSLDTKKVKDLERVEPLKDLREDDEEAKIEKELAEIYKDTDYKADNTEAAAPKTGPLIARSGGDKTFQPHDLNNKEDVQRFRTSEDSVGCERDGSHVTNHVKSEHGLQANFAPSSAATAAILAAIVAAILA